MVYNDATIVVNVNGELIVLVGTPTSFVIQCDNPDFVVQAKKYMVNSTDVPLVPGMPYHMFPTGKNSYLELVASMVAVDAGRAFIVSAPDEVLQVLNKVGE